MKQSSGKPTPTSLLGKSLYVGNYYVTVQKKLGEGGFATIYQAVHRHHQGSDGGQFFALKHFRINGDLEKLNSVKRECLLMNNIKKHPNIVTLYAACFAGTPIATDGFFLMELCHQDLVKALTANHRHMTESDILGIFLQVAQGVSYMHSQSPPVAHWDLKAENILQSLSGSWVVCDFGSSTTIDEVPERNRIPELEDTVRRNTTAAYRAPELYDLWNRHRVNTQVDIFALGVLLYLMCFSKFPFQADSKLAVLKGNFPIPPSHHRPETRQLISRMLIVDPAKRPNIHEVIACTKSLLASPPSHSAPPPQAAHTPPPTPPVVPALQKSHALPHSALAGYPPAVSAAPLLQQHPPAYAGMHSPPPPQQATGYVPASVLTAAQGGAGPQALGASPLAQQHGQPVDSAGGTPRHTDGPGLTRFDPFTRAIGSADAGMSGTGAPAAPSDPFVASETFTRGAGSRLATVSAPGNAALSGQTTSSAPVSPQKQALQQAAQLFGTGAHTAGSPRKRSAEYPAGAAAAEAKSRVFPQAHGAAQSLQPFQNQNLQYQRQQGVPQSPVAGASHEPAAMAAGAAVEGGYAHMPPHPPPGTADSAEQADMRAAQVALSSYKEANRLTARRAAAAAYVAQSGEPDVDCLREDVDGAVHSMSQLQIENEKLRAEMKELAARMAGGAAEAGAGEVARLHVEAEKARQEREDLAGQLEDAKEELDRRRLQVGEMRSIIDAISVAPVVNGAGFSGASAQRQSDMSSEGSVPVPRSPQRSPAVSPKKNGNSTARLQIAHSGLHEVGQRVISVLNETAGWKRRGLRRSVSEVHVDWSEFEEESPLQAQ